jgi:hypothetical protein
MYRRMRTRKIRREVINPNKTQPDLDDLQRFREVMYDI